MIYGYKKTQMRTAMVEFEDFPVSFPKPALPLLLFPAFRKNTVLPTSVGNLIN